MGKAPSVPGVSIFIAVGMVACLAQPAAAGGSAIELIVDVSGSMAARVGGGATRMDAAKSAVTRFLAAIPDTTRVGLRAYGHQSLKEQHDCNDTAMLVAFAPLGANRARMVAETGRLQPRGYTPITLVIGLAAGDLAKENAEQRTVILVSDGKETCAGDPCETARALKAADARLVIHTIGLGVDEAARTELRCIAASTGGSYQNAEDAGGLASALTAAAKKAPVAPQLRKDGRGKLHIKNEDWHGQQVLDASGKVVVSMNSGRATVPLAAGIYSVKFGPLLWRSVEIRDGQTTELAPGMIRLEHPTTQTIEVVDSETGALATKLNDAGATVTVIPGLYTLRFAKGVEWPFIRVHADEATVVRPAIIAINEPRGWTYLVTTKSGVPVRKLMAGQAEALVPPGDYLVEVNKGESKAVSVREGERVAVTSTRR